MLMLNAIVSFYFWMAVIIAVGIMIYAINEAIISAITEAIREGIRLYKGFKLSGFRWLRWFK